MEIEKCARLEVPPKQYSQHAVITHGLISVEERPVFADLNVEKYVDPETDMKKYFSELKLITPRS